MMAWLLAAFLLGLGAGAGALAWLGREDRAEARRRWRRDRVREAVVLAWENLYGNREERALKWARKALRLNRRHPEAHAVLGACRQAVEHYGQAIWHHRRAEELATEVGVEAKRGLWRLQNALDAVQACMVLRDEACEAEAQMLWDEAAAWARLAHEINPSEASEALARSPWLSRLSPRGGEAWLQP